MSNGTKKNIKIIIPSLRDDEGARMFVIPLLRNPSLTHDCCYGKRGSAVPREGLIEWVKSLLKGISESEPCDAEQIINESEVADNSIDNIATVTGYADYAINKEKAVWIYDGLAVFFAVVGIALVAFALASLQVDVTSALVFRLGVSVAPFAVSSFLFKRVTYNQREAKVGRRTDLTLREFKLLIADFDDEDKRKIANKMAERIFVKGEIGDREEKAIPNTLLDRGIIDKQIALLVALIKALSKDSQN